MTPGESGNLSPTEERQFEKLLFGVRRSIRYHNHRRRFFDGLDKFTKILSAVAGSAAVATALGHHNEITVGLALVIAVFSTVDLIIGSGPAARVHSDLAKRFAELEATIIRIGTPKPDEVRGWIADRLMIEADEPPIFRVLDSVVHNELCNALACDEHEFVKIGWFQGKMAQFLDLWPAKIRKHSRPKTAGTPTAVST